MTLKNKLRLEGLKQVADDTHAVVEFMRSRNRAPMDLAEVCITYLSYLHSISDATDQHTLETTLRSLLIRFYQHPKGH